ncbi:MAG: hypothetical protein HZA90_03600 [Verrucomicrobia bacterium]|nr:hypothetical protein [Verrucomicrobiota bacterium]
MGWFNHKKDPISKRARELQAQIEQLEAQIHNLSAEAARSQPRLRSTTLPALKETARPAPPGPANPTKPASEQVFEKVDHQRLQASPDAEAQVLYNELGVRKYDLPGAWSRMKNAFRSAPAPNQPFVKLLAAGNIQGLKPLRYERRVARRRFVVFAILLFLALWALLAVMLRR